MDSGRSGNLDESPARSGASIGDASGSGASDVGGGDVLHYEDLCDITIETRLQHIEQCDFYLETFDVPPAETQVRIERRNKRVVALNAEGKTIGAIPARYDQELAECMESGIKYAGKITHSSAGPPVIIEVIIGLDP